MKLYSPDITKPTEVNYYWHEKVLVEPMPKPKQGEWIIDWKERKRIWHCHCPNCKKDPLNYVGGTDNWWLVRLPNYCPHCGAKMKGAYDE